MECGGKRASGCTLRIFRSASDEGGSAKSSVRSAMCIGTASPNAWPSSVGAACFLVTKARQYAHRQPKYAAPTELGCILGGLVAINMALLKELLNNPRRKSV